MWFFSGCLFFGSWFLHEVFNITNLTALIRMLLMQATDVFTGRFSWEIKK